MKATAILIALLSVVVQLDAQFNLKNESSIDSNISIGSDDISRPIEGLNPELNNETGRSSVMQILKPELPDFEEYSGKYSLGVAIGRDGIPGAVLRYYPRRDIAIESGIKYNPTIVRGRHVEGNRDWALAHTIMFTGGALVYIGEGYRPYRDKIMRNGIMVKFGFQPSDILQQEMYVVGWSRQAMKGFRKNYNYNFEMGIGWMKDKTRTTSIGPNFKTTSNILESAYPIFYWSCNWSAFLRPGGKRN
jgi:hypothetical protein